MKVLVDKGMSVDNVVLNAGVLKYPNRATEVYVTPFPPLLTHSLHI